MSALTDELESMFRAKCQKIATMPPDGDRNWLALQQFMHATKLVEIAREELGDLFGFPPPPTAGDVMVEVLRQRDHEQSPDRGEGPDEQPWLPEGQ